VTSNIAEAIALIFLAALMNATYTLPMKLNRQWKWEHSWFAFTFLGVAVVPTIIAMATVPGLWAIYPQIPAGTLLRMAVFGATWGVSLVLFGLSISIVGVAITFAVCLGTSAASGALIPLLVQHSDRLLTRDGALILGGICWILVGVGLCGLAGHRRDRLLATKQDGSSLPFSRGFLYAIVSGVTGSMLNLGLAFGGAIQERARQQGASAAMMSNAVWLPCLYAGFVPGIIYCLSIMKKNDNVGDLTSKSRWYYWLMGACMGVLWFGSIICYSLSTIKLGDLGPVIGWPLFMSAVVIASTIAGMLTGEWSRAGAGPIRIMNAGVFCLVAAMGLLALAGQ
jgi:L-rhamnose-H+ transport protein